MVQDLTLAGRRIQRGPESPPGLLVFKGWGLGSGDFGSLGFRGLGFRV